LFSSPNQSFLEWTLFSLNTTPIILTLIIDPIGIVFASTVLFISANVLRFSTIYIRHDAYPTRFTALVLIFILSINLLIFLPQFIILLLGWDGLGIVSFILVIYYQNPKSLGAGIITALTNRVGDVILLLSIAWTINQGHWLITNIWDSKLLVYQIIAITLAAITKSAQMPFSRWLPAAIAAPTPVSALVHSSTLVTAGVFLIIRFYPFLSSSSFFNKAILFIAVSTIIIAGLRAINECDIKKIIALSTLRQLGIIITRIGFRLPTLAYFHIITHALFKALLFICAGSFINDHSHAQDLRWIGNITNQAPIATSCITAANLALCGFPFIAGFYSKDLIIESAIFIRNNLSILYICLISLGFTSFYSIRFTVVVLWSQNLSNPFIQLNEWPPITNPILYLSFISIITGRALSWIIPISSYTVLSPSIKIRPVCIVFLGAVIAFFLTSSLNLNTAQSIKLSILHYASCIIWFLVPLSTQLIMRIPLKFSHNYIKLIDQGWIESIFAQGVKLNILTNRNLYLTLSPKLPTSYLLSSFSISLIFLFIYWIWIL